jgi:hypothetical protein
MLVCFFVLSQGGFYALAYMTQSALLNVCTSFNFSWKIQALGCSNATHEQGDFHVYQLASLRFSHHRRDGA